MDYDLLSGIYKRIADSEFKPGTDHVTQVDTVEKITQGMKQVVIRIHIYYVIVILDYDRVFTNVISFIASCSFTSEIGLLLSAL